MEPIAMIFGTALVAAMATNTWRQAHEAVAALWRRVYRPQGAGAIEAELRELREQAVAVRRDGRADLEEVLVGVWRGRCQDLLRGGPDVADELAQAVGEVLAPMLAPPERARAGSVIMAGSSHGSSTFSQVAGDQYSVGP